MTTIFPLLTLLLGSPAAHAQYAETACGDVHREVEVADIECLVKELIPRDFPELKNALAEGRIGFTKFNSETTFIQSAIVGGFVRPATSRYYEIRINPAMTRTFLPALPRPTLQAVQAALAHELVHLTDYEKSSAVGLLRFAKLSLLDNVAYERATDERSFELGYAYGLELYRQWLQTRLPETEYAKKMEGYYQPEEIQAWINQFELSRPVH